MPRLLYTLFFYAIVPLVLLRLCYRALKAPAYRHRIGERFGFFRRPNVDGCIWVHAVSVGEAIAAAPLIRRLLQQYPDIPLVVTTMTPTGSERVRALFGDSVFHVYAPYDLPDAVARFLNRVRPRLAVIMETEIWPNTVAACRKRGIDVLLANARLSERSANGYARLAGLTRLVFGQLSHVVAQTQADADRFTELGVDRAALTVSGSIKFDISLGEPLRAEAARLKQLWSEGGQRQLWIAASTHEGEDEQILDAFAQLRHRQGEALLILVPRHPERFERVAALVSERGFTLHRRSRGEALAPGTQVLLGDTMGELLLLYGCADVATVGGSLIEHGGHNSLEPAAWGLPLVNGPSEFNFAQVSELLQQAGALEVAEDSAALAARVGELLQQPERARVAGEAARAVVEANRGALDRLLAVVGRYLPAAASD